MKIDKIGKQFEFFESCANQPLFDCAEPPGSCDVDEWVGFTGGGSRMVCNSMDLVDKKE